jgi:hypothetical protein
MTLQADGQIAISDISQEIGQAATYSTSLNFLNGLLRSDQRPASPNLTAFYSKAYFQNSADGANCANGNCTANCNCGNIQCNNCYISGAINCGNCDTQSWLQNNCNCACTYNCDYANTSYNCNCACNCSKIVCGKLHEYGLMNSNIWAADQAYGRRLRKTDKAVYRGYFRWARPVTQWMDGQGPDFMLWVPKQHRAKAQQELMIELTYRVGAPWSEHMAYEMGTLKNDNQQGRILMKIGRFFCRAVNLIPKVPTKYKRSTWLMPYSLLSSYTIWFLLELSYCTSTICVKTLNLFDANKKEVKEY